MRKFNMMKLKCSQSGFSLIELMVAMVIGLIVLLGLVSLFTNVSSLNRSQNGLSILQENGRYAITRLQQDIENAGKKHCSSVAFPTAFKTDWNQGYEMKAWYVDRSVNFNDTGSPSTNGLPTFNQVSLDSTADANQLGDTATTDPAYTYSFYPLDASFFIRGHECTGTNCLPQLTTVGSDSSAGFGTAGTSIGNRVPNTDILTLRSLNGTGVSVNAINANVATTVNTLATTGVTNTLIADCNRSLVSQGTWGGNTVTFPNNLPDFSVDSDTRMYDMNNDFSTVSYFLRVTDDPSDSGNRVISSLFRSENGVAQQIVEGVERFDVFYLVQLQTGRVARLTASQVQQVQGGGDFTVGDVGCILPSILPDIDGYHLPNDQGCLWRSVYAIEVHLLLNTVNNSSTNNNEVFNYSVDPTNPQNPATGLVTGLPAERMYRREFSAIVPIRNYSL